MSKAAYHPNAYLSIIKNNRRGLSARTRILNALEKGNADTRTIVNLTGDHYGVISHHLKLLKKERIAQRIGDRPYEWVLTGAGQKRLITDT